VGDLAAYYDRLSLWTTIARVFGYGGGRDALTVHRALADPRADGRPTPTRVHDLLADALPPLGTPRVLDAGCGMGGTMIDFARRVGGTYVGLTLSEKRAAIGRRAAGRAGHGPATIQFLIQSYDAPPEGPFDLIVAIESLAHSSDPARTLQHLFGSLSPSGILAVVDDMPEPDVSTDKRSTSDLVTFKSGWSCPVLWGASEYRAAFTRLGLKILTDVDLSPHVASRSANGIRQFERLNRLAHRAIPSESWRRLMDSYHGLALERLYRHGAMSYRMMLGARARDQNAVSGPARCHPRSSSSTRTFRGGIETR